MKSDEETLLVARCKKTGKLSFKVRFKYLTNLFETHCKKEIEFFKETGNTNLDEEEILSITKQILDI